ncbi:MAG: hypothetical protein LBK91_05800 [Synergistaceae bacterium]|jgi:hypothetical protein|nr:hypothetical protein [Synergistaceae bacterium]
MPFFVKKPSRATARIVATFACIAFAVSFVAVKLCLSSQPPIVRLDSAWKSMGMMMSDDISGHRVEIERKSRTVRHTVLTNFGEDVAAEFDYQLDERACEDFFEWLENRSGINGWRSDYTVEMMDGWAWKMNVTTELKSRAIKGNTLPPRGGEVEKRILALADFSVVPNIF